jgi:hypothetical protein
LGFSLPITKPEPKPQFKPDPLLGGFAPKKRGPYRPKNELDGFLRSSIGGKYKWRRYEIFSDYLQRGHGHSEKKATEIIAKYQVNGIPDRLYSDTLYEIKRWLHICNQERAKKANAAKWEKYRKKKSKNP